MAFIDEAKIYLKAGDGGKGCESSCRDTWRRYPKPNGGDGGKGGDIILVASKSIQTLLDYRFKQHYKSKRGGHGGSHNKKGKEGDDSILKVPVGTLIRDHKTNLLIKDLVFDKQKIVVVKGGQGGRGNAHKKTPCPPGVGETKTIRLELKLIADVGIIGFPNAGKSTLISAISSVRSKIAGYPFTTRSPILGIVKGDESDFIVADLPGLIEGAHEGKGLGDRFLRHAERTKILLHLVDIGSSEGRDPIDDFEKINEELREHSSKLFFKHKIVVANKMDLPGASQNLKKFRKKYKEGIFEISALEKTGLKELVDFLWEALSKEQ